MVNLMVGRATSNVLIGPDWSMNTEICDICNYDPVQAKDVVRGIKKRLGSKNPKVQLLALTLLETIVKNCGDIVHMHVADKDLPREMVKIVRKKPDFHVKEKILILIDTWQEAFGGPRARFPQYFVAYQDLLRIGAVFPQRSESSAPAFTPTQTHPLTSNPQNLRGSESRPDAAESSSEAEFPTLSLTELQNARGVMDVLAEMLNALNPGDKEGLKPNVIVDLVDQCRTYKQRVVHLVSSTSDESLLCQGLALNDDFQRVLAKHESLASGTISVQPEKSKPELTQALNKVDSPFIDTGDVKLSDKGSTSGASSGNQLVIAAPPATNGHLTKSIKAVPMIDLLCGDDFSAPTANSRALVPVGEPQSSSSATSQQNVLALLDLFPQGRDNQSFNTTGQAHPSSAQVQQSFQVSQPSALYSSGSVSVSGPGWPQYEQKPYSQGSSSWNGQITQQQQPSSLIYGAQNSGVMPPPLWEALLDNNQVSINQPPQQVQVAHSQPLPSGTYFQGSQHSTNDQISSTYIQPISGGHLMPVNNHFLQTNQISGPYLQPIHDPQTIGMFPLPVQPVPMVYMYPQQAHGYQMTNYGYGYGHGQGQLQLLEQNMSRLSVRDVSAMSNSTPSYARSGKPSKPEDKLFGDLVDMSKFKPGRTRNT